MQLLDERRQDARERRDHVGHLALVMDDVAFLVEAHRVAVAVDVASARLAKRQLPDLRALIVADRLFEMDDDRPLVVGFERRQLCR